MDNTLMNSQSLPQRLHQVCQQIAPTWPLDQMIAVNPYWELRHQSYIDVAARFQVLHQIQTLPDVKESIALFERGALSAYALKLALEEAGSEQDIQKFILKSLSTGSANAQHLTVLQCLDRSLAAERLPWLPELTSHVSQFCAWYFQQNDGNLTAEGDLYQQYHRFVAADLGLDLLLSADGLHQHYARLPKDLPGLLAHAEQELVLAGADWSFYAEVLLRQINGWASWSAYQSWQARLAGQNHSLTPDLMAMMLGWELAAYHYLAAVAPEQFVRLRAQWLNELAGIPHRLDFIVPQQQVQWIWWRAAEIQYQQALVAKLSQRGPQPQAAAKLQAVFCIDVRSETIRRQLEQQDAAIQTLGFAGFFGLPIEYRPAGSQLRRPQLPGLLAPVLTATANKPQESLLRSALRRGQKQLLGRAALPSFAMVESSGWLALPALIGQTLRPQSQPDLFADLSHTESWTLSLNGQPLSVEAQADLAIKVLHLMGLTEFAPTVLIVGHGSQSNNNLHAGCLECGACGGQSGEVNSRVLAGLLNDPAVRAQMAASGVQLPQSTRFVAALHNTTTDEIQCFAAVPPEVQRWLREAATATQRERFHNWHTETLPSDLAQQLHAKAGDWSETRPEWGLANNAAFIIAPRAWTKGVDFSGRVFLHDYAAELDHDGSTLELLLTAPLVVTNWINMQYNASVTDPHTFGSGNKVLHNAVGGHIGVFEGQSGDLRIGLPQQSVHNGERFMHQPLRLTAVVAASQQAIEHILAKHADVRALVENGWLYLWQWQPGEKMQQWQQGTWQEVALC